MDEKVKTPSAHGREESAPATNMDEKAMARMGRVQELKRRFGPVGILGFASVLGAAWQSVLISFVFSLGNGGPTGTVVMYLVTIFGLFMISLSLAEMGSIAPTAGGQYHWVSEFAPARVQKGLSFLMGWVTVFGWQIYVIASTTAAVKQIQGIVVLYLPAVTFTAWQFGLMTIAVLLLETGFNVAFATMLQGFEVVLLVLHIGAFIVFEAVFLALGPRGSVDDVFDNFVNEYDWPTLAGAVLVGILAPLSALTTADSVAHLAEELKDASKWLPRTIISNATINYTISFLLLITMLFRTGDINAALASGNPMPYIPILQSATKSRGGTMVLVLYIFAATFFSTVNMITTSSRQLYAFARDGGVPFPRFFAAVDGRGIPRNAIFTTLICNIILALILTGSDTAFQIIISLGVVLLMCSYMISIGCITYFRLQGRTLPNRDFSLGGLGLPINVVGLLFAAFAFLLVFFPAAPHPTPMGMNWSCVLFSFLILVAAVLYIARQRHVYVPPVALLRKD